MAADPLNPSSALLVKLGSIVRHAEEAVEPGGHAFDQLTIRALLEDEETATWMQAMDALALLPVKRSLS